MFRFEKLSSEILELSHADTFDGAVQEWKLAGCTRVDDDGDSFCLCGQAIKHEFLIVNRVTELTAIVGSTCVSNFMAANEQLVVDVARAAYEAARRRCARCDEWTVHPEHCKRCEKALEKLRNRYRECSTAGCLAIVDGGGYCPACIRIRAAAMKAERDRARDMARQAELAARAHEWYLVESSIDIDRLNPAERDFVTVSVYRCCIHGRMLTDRQAAWLEQIKRKYPGWRR